MIPALTAANLLAWFVQVTAVVLLGGVALQAARLQSPRVRLACFRLLLVACLLLPFLPAAATGSIHHASGLVTSRTAGPAGVSAAPADSVDVTPANASRTVAGPAQRTAVWLRERAVLVALVLLVAGSVARLAWLLVGLLALRRLRGDAVSVDDGDAATDRAIDLAGATASVFTSRAVRHPVTFGLRRPVILLPESYASLDDSEQVAVVCHELLHVRRHDWLQIVAEELLRAALWFHPAIWWLLARIDLSREQLVDQEVVALTERRRPYVKALVTLAMDPAGPVLRPASLFLGRAHLLQRVALLSREVRMSRPRLVVSLALVLAVLVLGGRFVVHAFPLTAASAVSPASPLTIAAPSLPAPAIALRGDAALPTVSVGTPALLAAAAAPPQTSQPPQKKVVYPEALTRAEPVLPAPLPLAGMDLVVAAQVAVQPAGDAIITGPWEMFMGRPGKRSFSGAFESTDGIGAFSNATVKLAEGTGLTYLGDATRAAYDALRAWRFAAIDQPFKTVIGLNLARGEQSGGESTPVRVGAGVAVPVRTRNVAPVYPQEAQDKRIQGVVIMELVIDGAGIPNSAYVLRPVEGLSMAAVEAALQWRYQPDPNYSRRLMTVTVNFTLTGDESHVVPHAQAGVSGGVVGGVPGGVVGGVRSGVVGGAQGGVVGGVAGVVDSPVGSFGLPQSEWPSNALRVGGNIAAPTRTRNVNPVYPVIAQNARVQGVVIVEVLIAPAMELVPLRSTVQGGRILRSIPLLDQAAIDAVQQWQYTPTLLNGSPVPVIMTVTVNFTLQ